MAVVTLEAAIPNARATRTRRALLSAGRKLFAERPFDAVAIDDIVNEAGVAKGTFYNHFLDKDALLAAIFSDIREAVEARIALVNADVDDAAMRIVRALCVYVARTLDDPVEGHILLHNDPRGTARESLNDGLRDDLSAGLRSGRLVLPSIEAGLLYVIGVAHGLLLSAILGRDGTIMIMTTQQICMMLLRSFGLPPQEAELIASQATDDIIRLRAY